MEREREYTIGGEREKKIDDGKDDNKNSVLNEELVDWATVKIYTIGGESGKIDDGNEDGKNGVLNY